MKYNIFKVLLIAVLPTLVISCIDNIPEVEDLPTEKVMFNYRIPGQFPLDYYIYSEIIFTNTSPEIGEQVWDFGDGSPKRVKPVGEDTVMHFYDAPGSYNVTLKIGEYKKTQIITIADIKPIIFIDSIDSDICEATTTKVTFDKIIPNPAGLDLQYQWVFPAGTKNEQGVTIDTISTEDPGTVIFGNVGSQKVILNVKMGTRQLNEGIVNVQVGYKDSVPTLYYATQGGNIMAYKLINNPPTDMKVSPFDLGVSSGEHSFCLLCDEKNLFMLDCGKQFYFVDDEAGVLGDGKISVVALDGSKVETMLTNVGQAAFDDPFYGYIDMDEKDYLYYANRNTGIIKVPITDRDKVYSESTYPYYVQHNYLGYYNNGWGFGAIGGTFGKINNVWHWCKFYQGNGIYRFTKDDILTEAKKDGDPAPAAGIALHTMSPKSYAYSPKQNRICFTLMDDGNMGLYDCTYDELNEIGTSKSKLPPYKVLDVNGKSFECSKTGPSAIEGTGSEAVGICQIAYDEETDCIYFAYRAAGQPDVPDSGIYKHKFGTKTAELVIPDVNAYGIVVNNKRSKLF